MVYLNNCVINNSYNAITVIFFAEIMQKFYCSCLICLAYRTSATDIYGLHCRLLFLAFQ